MNSFLFLSSNLFEKKKPVPMTIPFPDIPSILTVLNRNLSEIVSILIHITKDRMDLLVSSSS